MEDHLDYKIIAIHSNNHIDEEIADAVRQGFLWIWAVPRIGPYSVCTHPTHLILSSVSMNKDDAQRIYQSWERFLHDGA